MPMRPKALIVRATPKQEQRGTFRERGYTTAWTKLSVAFRKANPLCAECERQGRITAATCVDHIVPHRGDAQLVFDRDNLQSLCARCHGRKTRGGQ